MTDTVKSEDVRELDPVEVEREEKRRRRRNPPFGERDHGELSTHRGGPNAGRHSEDVLALLRDEREGASQRLERAERAHTQAERDMTRWASEVDHYDQLIEAITKVEPRS